MKILTTLFLLTVMTCSLNAQTIDMKKSFGAYQFFQNGEKLKVSEVVNRMESNSEAFELMKSAQVNNAIGQTIAFAGGFMVGWSIGGALGSESEGINWSLFGIGAGLAVISIPFSANFNKKAQEAVYIYNTHLDSSSFRSPVLQFKLEATVNKVGIVISF